MRLARHLHAAGMTAAVVIVVGGQLIWLGDPLRWGADGYWVDLVNELFYLCLVPPLCWLAGGWASLRKGEGRRGAVLQTAIQWLVIVLSLLSIYWILCRQGQWIGLLASFSAAWLLALAGHVAEAWQRDGAGRGLRRLSVWAIALFILLCPTPYMVTYPGMTINMNAYVSAEGGMPRGSIMGVLVFERPAFPIDWLYGRLFPQYEFARRPADDLPLTEQIHLAQQMRASADQIGSALAFEKAGIGGGIAFHGVRVTGVIAGMPAEGALQAGDLIVAVNGRRTESSRTLLSVLSLHRPGERLELEVERDGNRRIVAIQAASAPDNPDRAVLGIYLRNELELDVPRAVHFREYVIHVGGPSHGAMLTLALIDQLVPDGVTGGNIVAGTGTIDEHGQIGPIGGIRQKAYAVSRTKADVFFVPADQLEEAKQAASPQLRIVPVRSMDEILDWLQRNPKVR